jgi:hypothetical protein
MSEISKIKVGSTSYDLKDADARSRIAALESYSDFLGVTTTQLVDGVTTSPVITINGDSVTAKKGNIAIYGSAEFIYDGTVWQEFGDLSALQNLLGDLAYEDTAEGSFTPAGTVSRPSVTVTPTTANITGVSANGTLPSFSYDSATETLEFSAGALPTLDTPVAAMTGATAALNSDPVFSGTQATITVAAPSAP